MFLAALSVQIQNEVVLYAAVFVTGVFVFSSQVLVYAWVSQLFPVRLRGTALGFAAGVGRLGAILGPAVTGTLVAAGIAYPWGFYVFAAAAVLAVAALAFVPHTIPAASRAGASVGHSARRSARVRAARRPLRRRHAPGASTTAMPTAAPMIGLHDPVAQQECRASRAPPAASRSGPAA